MRTRNISPRHITTCHMTSRHYTPHHIKSHHHITSQHVTYITMSHHTMSHHITSCPIKFDLLHIAPSSVTSNHTSSRQITLVTLNLILFQNHPQRYTWKETFHDNLTLPKSVEKCWLERDLNSHLRDTSPPLYLLSYRVHLNWIKVASNPYRLDSSTGRAVDRCPEGASSNPTRVNIFHLTSAVSDYHKKFPYIKLSLQLITLKHVASYHVTSHYVITPNYIRSNLVTSHHGMLHHTSDRSLMKLCYSTSPHVTSQHVSSPLTMW